MNKKNPTPGCALPIHFSPQAEPAGSLTVSGASMMTVLRQGAKVRGHGGRADSLGLPTE